MRLGQRHVAEARLARIPGPSQAPLGTEPRFLFRATSRCSRAWEEEVEEESFWGRGAQERGPESLSLLLGSSYFNWRVHQWC